jgi:hypothetical protein
MHLINFIIDLRPSNAPVASWMLPPSSHLRHPGFFELDGMQPAEICAFLALIY